MQTKTYSFNQNNTVIYYLLYKHSLSIDRQLIFSALLDTCKVHQSKLVKTDISHPSKHSSPQQPHSL